MMERWVSIFPYPYQVSTLGRVRRGSEIVDPTTMNKGYLRVKIKGLDEPRGHRHLVHRLVAAAFFGMCPEGYVVHHMDGDKQNNGLDNLEYLSLADHVRLHNPAQKLTDVLEAEARQEMLALVRKYGVSPGTLANYAKEELYG